MKKNILAIIILAATVVNITLTAIILFTVVPKAQRTDSLIQRIVAVIDLELENPDAKDYAEVAPEDQEFVALPNSAATWNLSSNTEKAHYAVVSKVTIVLNKKSADYKAKSGLILTTETAILQYVREELTKYSLDDVRDHQDDIRKAVIRDLGTYFDSTDLICNVIIDFMTN